MIVAHQVSKRYADQQVLKNVTLQVKEGEIFGFVGPNGAGKTTFMKCLAGICRADSGELQIAGLNVPQQSLLVRRLLGYAPSETAMYDSMRVLDFLKFAITYHRHADLDYGRKLLVEFELPEKKRVSQLSHGMKRKLLLTQALCCGASVLLLDEPMEGLDPQARRQVETLLLEISAQGKTVFYSSHDLASVERICHRVAFLRKGELIECAPVSEIISRVSAALGDQPLEEIHAHVTLEKVFSSLYGGEL